MADNLYSSFKGWINDSEKEVFYLTILLITKIILEVIEFAL